MRMPKHVVRRIALSVVPGIAMALMLPAGAGAQTPSSRGTRKWTVEFYAGGATASGSSSGAPIGGFPAGAPFTMQSSRPSRQVSSWYFGDGSALLNDVLGQFAATTGTSFTRVVPLDAALKAGGASYRSGATFGVRLGRALSPRLSLELSAERSLASPALSGALQDALAASRDSFKLAFQDLLATAGLSNVSVNSSLTVPDPTSGMNQLTGSLTWTIFERRRLSAYLTGGGGAIQNAGDPPEAKLSGTYSFRLLGTYTITETDSVVVTIDQPKWAAAGLVGGGVTWNLSSRAGLRADVRVLLSPSSASTVVNATPSAAPQTPTTVLPTITTPGIQFSSQSGVVTSLSGAPATLTTFSGSGLSRQMSITFGIFRRF